MKISANRKLLSLKFYNKYLLYNYINCLGNTSELYKMSKKCSLKDAGASYKRFVSTNNCGQNSKLKVNEIAF